LLAVLLVPFLHDNEPALLDAGDYGLSKVYFQLGTFSRYTSSPHPSTVDVLLGIMS
jgi:hypothetical protein